jgi:hypothetical protein
MDDAVVLVHGGAAVELLAAGGAGHVIVHVDVHMHRLHVALEVKLPEEGAPAKVAFVVLHLVIKSEGISDFPKIMKQNKIFNTGTWLTRLTWIGAKNATIKLWRNLAISCKSQQCLLEGYLCFSECMLLFFV